MTRPQQEVENVNPKKHGLLDGADVADEGKKKQHKIKSKVVKGENLKSNGNDKKKMFSKKKLNQGKQKDAMQNPETNFNREKGKKMKSIDKKKELEEVKAKKETRTKKTEVVTVIKTDCI